MSGTETPIMSSRSRIRGTPAPAAGVFTVMRTSSDPARASSATCFAVDAGSSVSVLVMDWTTIGAPPPTRTRSIRTPVLGRRAPASGGRGRPEWSSVIAGYFGALAGQAADRPFDAMAAAIPDADTLDAMNVRNRH